MKRISLMTAMDAVALAYEMPHMQGRAPLQIERRKKPRQDEQTPRHARNPDTMTDADRVRLEAAAERRARRNAKHKPTAEKGEK